MHASARVCVHVHVLSGMEAWRKRGIEPSALPDVGFPRPHQHGGGELSFFFFSPRPCQASAPWTVTLVFIAGFAGPSGTQAGLLESGTRQQDPGSSQRRKAGSSRRERGRHKALKQATHGLLRERCVGGCGLGRWGKSGPAAVWGKQITPALDAPSLKAARERQREARGHARPGARQQRCALAAGRTAGELGAG